MSATNEFVASLPEEQADFIDQMVATDTYGSASEVISAGLRVLQQEKEHNAALEHWLREEVAPAYDALSADPTRVISAEALQDRLREHHLKKAQPGNAPSP